MATARRPHAAAHIKIAAGAPTRPPVGGFPKRGSPATASAASSSARRAGRCIATAAPMSGSGPASRLHRACDGCTQGLRWPLSNHVGPLLLKNCATPARQLQAAKHTRRRVARSCVSLPCNFPECAPPAALCGHPCRTFPQKLKAVSPPAPPAPAHWHTSVLPIRQWCCQAAAPGEAGANVMLIHRVEV